jgi:hypothetical protein|eukprot:COSAG06_NODE_3381_length_5427_cov_3.749812_6_plen_69_part_00
MIQCNTACCENEATRATPQRCSRAAHICYTSSFSDGISRKLEACYNYAVSCGLVSLLVGQTFLERVAN